MQELGTGNLVSGTARMAGTGLVFVLLAFGVGLGQRLGARLAAPGGGSPVPCRPGPWCRPSPWWPWPS